MSNDDLLSRITVDPEICQPGTRPQDRAINHPSFDEQRVVISKDTDLFYSHLLHGRPWKLLLVKAGNISTRDLRALFERNPACDRIRAPDLHARGH